MIYTKEYKRKKGKNNPQTINKNKLEILTKKKQITMSVRRPYLTPKYINLAVS